MLSLTPDHVQVVFAGIPFVFLNNFFAHLLRAMGNSVAPLAFLSASSVASIALDLAFVPGLHMDVLVIWWAILIGWMLADAAGLALRQRARM